MRLVTSWLASLLRGLFILCLPLLLVSASITLAVNSSWLYKQGFEKYNISQVTGLDKSELDKVATGLISYFNSDKEDISLTVIRDGRPFQIFNEKEVAHLRDVKDLMLLDYRVLLVTLVYSLVYIGVMVLRRKDLRLLAWSLIVGSAFTLALILAVGLAALINFDEFFLQFHLLSFTNQLWQLDPARDYLIMLFPEGFWYDATFFCGLAAAAGALILGGIGAGCLLLGKSEYCKQPDAE